MVNFLWFLIRPFAWLARWIRKIFRTAFGQLSYRPPYWLQRGFTRAHVYRRAHPVLPAGLLCGGFLIARGSGLGSRPGSPPPPTHTGFPTVSPIPRSPRRNELNVSA